MEQRLPADRIERSVPLHLVTDIGATAVDKEVSRPKLTKCELAELIRGSEGYTTEQAALEADRSQSVILSRRSKLFQRLNVRNMAHATRVGFEMNILETNGEKIDPDAITEDERAYLEHVSYGLTVPEIMGEMGLNEETSDELRKAIYTKFDTEMMAYAVRIGFQSEILQPTPPENPKIAVQDSSTFFRSMG